MTAKRKPKEVRELNCTVGDMRALTMALGEVGQNRMPITYALRIKGVLSSLSQVADDVDARLAEIFKEHAGDDGKIKRGTEVFDRFQVAVNEYLEDTVTLEIPPDPIPVSVLMEKDIEITPVALETLLRHEVFSEEST